MPATRSVLSDLARIFHDALQLRGGCRGIVQTMSRFEFLQPPHETVELALGNLGAALDAIEV